MHVTAAAPQTWYHGMAPQTWYHGMAPFGHQVLSPVLIITIILAAALMCTLISMRRRAASQGK